VAPCGSNVRGEVLVLPGLILGQEIETSCRFTQSFQAVPVI
jgi:hypothetical protein